MHDANLVATGREAAMNGAEQSAIVPAQRPRARESRLQLHGLGIIVADPDPPLRVVEPGHLRRALPVSSEAVPLRLSARQHAIVDAAAAPARRARRVGPLARAV